LGCLLALIAVFMPRIALFIIWVFTPYVTRAFNHVWIWPLLGLIFLPFTTIIYSLVWVPGVGVTGASWVWVGFGVLLDVLWHGASASRRARRRAYD
jgi:hypothetical protein